MALLLLLVRLLVLRRLRMFHPLSHVSLCLSLGVSISPRFSLVREPELGLRCSMKTGKVVPWIVASGESVE